MGAVSSKNEELVSLLLQQPGIVVNASDDEGLTALHSAARSFGTGSPAIIRLLLDFPGIDMEAKDKHGWTPLTYSILYGTTAEFAEFFKNTGNSAK